jgi:hypothetical protein
MKVVIKRHTLAALSLGKQVHYPFNRRRGGYLRRSVRFCQEENIFSLGLDFDYSPLPADDTKNTVFS